MIPTFTNCALATAAAMVFLMCGLLEVSQAGVVGDFNHAERCKDSLFMGTPPRGYLSNSFKKICQRYEDKPRYVTLYDSHKHVPIYSAYTFKKSDGEKKVDFPWMFEPQVRVLASSVKDETNKTEAWFYSQFCMFAHRVCYISDIILFTLYIPYIPSTLYLFTCSHWRFLDIFGSVKAISPDVS